MILDLPEPLAVVCHDAGAANLIISWLAADPRPNVRAVMQGPAAKLWKARFGAGPGEMSIHEALDGAAALLSGTGWESDLEHNARVQAKLLGIVSTAVIDHWVNYPMRFVRDGVTQWPDMFWVADEAARAEAERCFPGARIVLKPNLYFEEQVSRIPALVSDAPDRILYIGEPALSDWGRGVPGEFQALDYFLANVERLGIGSDMPITIRPHPSEMPGKYEGWAASQKDFAIRVDVSSDLAEAISASKWVVGCQSFALVIALGAGRNVVCALPPWAPSCSLPHKALIHLRDLALRQGSAALRKDR